jgi:hypothetical protein
MRRLYKMSLGLHQRTRWAPSRGGVGCVVEKRVFPLRCALVEMTDWGLADPGCVQALIFAVTASTQKMGSMRYSILPMSALVLASGLERKM